MSNTMIIVGIAVGVLVMVGVMVYGTINQQSYLSEDIVLSQAAKQGSFASQSGMGANLNSEQWHEDPYAELAAKIRANAAAQNEP